MSTWSLWIRELFGRKDMPSVRELPEDGGAVLETSAASVSRGSAFPEERDAAPVSVTAIREAARVVAEKKARMRGGEAQAERTVSRAEPEADYVATDDVDLVALAEAGQRHMAGSLEAIAGEDDTLDALEKTLVHALALTRQAKAEAVASAERLKKLDTLEAMFSNIKS